MKKLTLTAILLAASCISSFSQTYNGVSIVTTNPSNYPWGININCTYSGAWAREFNFTHNGSENLFSFGTFGAGPNLIYGYIGGNNPDNMINYNAPWMVFLPNGDIGIGTKSPTAQLHIGKREASAGTAGSVRRLTIQPYSHTGGTWDFVARDAGNYAYMDIRYGARNIYTVRHDGNIGIGTASPGYRLDVVGTIRAHEVLVNTQQGADFVFEDSYNLRPLEEVEQFITQNKHLPGIAPASTMVQEGVNMGELQLQLLQKMEEMTLYMIELKKENSKQSELIKLQQEQITILKNELSILKINQ